MSRIKNNRIQSQAVWADTPWEDVAAYIGPHAEGFRRVWEKQRTAFAEKGYGITWSFCWPVFFLSFVWFFYRKQWLLGAVIIIIPTVFVILFPSAKDSFGGAALVLTLMAKSFYLQDALPKIAKIRTAEPDVGLRAAKLQKAGGASIIAGIISGGFYALMLLAAIIPLFVRHA